MTSQRHFAHRRILRVSASAYEAGVRLLATEAVSRFGTPTALVGIANGGLRPAADMANLLQVGHHRVDARHNATSATFTQATGEVSLDLQPLVTDLAGRHLTGLTLLVDDICGTGATFAAVTPPLETHLADGGTLRMAALCRNIGAELDPDLWLWNVDDWVLFPWEAPPPPDTVIEDLSTPRRALP